MIVQGFLGRIHTVHDLYVLVVTKKSYRMDDYTKIGHQLRISCANNGTNFEKERFIIWNQTLGVR